LVGKIHQQISEAIWSEGEVNYTFLVGYPYGGDGSWTVINGSTTGNPGRTNLGAPTLVGNVRLADTYGNQPLTWYNLSYVVSEPLIGWGESASSTFYIIGQMWDAVIANASIVLGTTGTFDSHNWYNLTAGNTTANLASVLHVVP